MGMEGWNDDSNSLRSRDYTVTGEWVNDSNGAIHLAPFHSWLSTQYTKSGWKGLWLRVSHPKKSKEPPSFLAVLLYNNPYFWMPYLNAAGLWPKFRGCPWTSLASTISLVLALKMPSGIGPLGPFNCWRRRIRICQTQLATGTMKPWQLDTWDDWD